MTRVLFLSFFAGLTAFASNIGAFGTWKISRVLDVAPIAAIDEKGAEKLIGTTLQIQKTSFSILGGDGCSTPTYRQEVETRSEYYKAYKMTGNPLKLPATVRTINASCTTLVPRGPNHLIFEWDGFFFEATRIRK